MVLDLGGFKDRNGKKALGRDDLAAEVAKRLEDTTGREVSKRQIREVVGEVFEAMATALMAGKRLEIRGFGVMVPHRTNARRVVSPLTGNKPVRVDAKWRVTFKTSRELRRRLMEHLEG